MVLGESNQYPLRQQKPIFEEILDTYNLPYRIYLITKDKKVKEIIRVRSVNISYLYGLFLPFYLFTTTFTPIKKENRLPCQLITNVIRIARGLGLALNSFFTSHL
jgi:hypothetical protein